MRSYLAGVTLAAILITAAESDEGDIVPVGLQKQLLVDDHVIAETRSVERVLGPTEKANDGRPIFEEGRFYGTVLHDEGRFKMWYRRFGQGGYGYAESDDGVRFSKEADVTGINFAGDFNLAVELNRPGGGPGIRYVAGYDAPGMAAGVAVSGDGIHWTPLNDGKPVTFRAADCHNQILWDPTAGTYRLFTRTDYGTGGGPLADTVAQRFEVRGTRGMTNPDILADPADWDIVRQWYFNREGEDEYLRRQIYSMTVWIYEGVYFALMSVYEFPGDVSEGLESDRLRRHERDVLNFYIATSRDCDAWHLTWVYAGEPIVPRGPDSSFDKDVVFPSSTVVTHDDRHWFYYSGNNERHGTAELDPPVWFDKQRAIGLATLPLDRFIGRHAGPREGTLVTRPFVLEGAALALNIDAAHGSLAIEILDADGQPMTGFSGEHAATHTSVDELRLTAKWPVKSDLSELVGETVRLRFRLQLADLYAFQVMAE